jgi:hypothetical protein
MSAAHEIDPPPSLAEILPGANFVDAYRLVVAEPGLSAQIAAQRMFDRRPAWIDVLMMVRDVAVRPFGLRTSTAATERTRKVGIFPVCAVAPNRIVLGADDKHLDFRIVVDTISTDTESAVTATTLVRLNNRLGRIYLTTILPFHRVIVPSLMDQLATRTASQRT